MSQRNVVAALRTMIRCIQPCTFLYKTSYLNQVAQKSPSEGLLGVPVPAFGRKAFYHQPHLFLPTWFLSPPTFPHPLLTNQNRPVLLGRLLPAPVLHYSLISKLYHSGFQQLWCGLEKLGHLMEQD